MYTGTLYCTHSRCGGVCGCVRVRVYVCGVCVLFGVVLFYSADVLRVLNREARGKRFAFQILCMGCKYHLATGCAEERERWVRGLETLLFGPPQPGIVCECILYII